MLRSPKTAPDVVYEDTFLINSDIKAGLPQARWTATSSTGRTGASSSTPRRRAAQGRRTARPTASRTAPTPAASGSTRTSSRKAGLPADWQPKTWDDVLAAARTIKEKVPGVIPLNVYTGKAAGEAAVMQGFEMLLYGTGEHQLYDPGTKKWVAGSQGFSDALKFVKTVYKEKLGPDVAGRARPQLRRPVSRPSCCPRASSASTSTAPGWPADWLQTGGQAVARVVQDARPGADADPERPGARQGQPVRRLDLVDPGKAANSPTWPGSSSRRCRPRQNALKWYVATRRSPSARTSPPTRRYLKAMPGIGSSPTWSRSRIPARATRLPQDLHRDPGRPWRRSRPVTAQPEEAAEGVRRAAEVASSDDQVIRKP